MYTYIQIYVLYGSALYIGIAVGGPVKFDFCGKLKIEESSTQCVRYR